MTTLKTKKIVRFAGALAAFAVVVSPLAASAATDTTSVEATVNSVVSVASATTVSVGVFPTASGSMSSVSDGVSVSTNSTTGYTLTFSNGDTTTSLASGANTIAAHAGTQGTPTVLATNTWGYRVDGVGGFGAGPTSTETNVADSAYTWAGVPSSSVPNTLKTTAATASSDVTTVWFGVEADSAVADGVYTDTITYTATVNP